MAQAMASMAGLRGSSQAVLEGSLQSNRLTTGNTGRTAVARTGFTVRAQKQSSGETETSRRAMLGLVAAGIASGSFVQAVLAEAKPIKVGPPPPPSGGLPGTLNSDEARDFDLPLKKRFYIQPLAPAEAAARAKESAKEIVGVKSLIDKKAWPYVQNDLRSKASYLRFDLNTVIAAKPKEEKQSLKDLTGKLFQEISNVNYFPLISKWTILVLSILLLFPSATCQPTCGQSGETFANNSTYEANLNALIASLSSNISSSGFLNASVGQSPDRVNAIVLCRGDISLPACRECVSATAPATVQRCPNTKDAIFWNETCMVRYSSQPIFRKLETQPVSQIPSKDGALNPQRHDQELTALLESLRGYAANGGSFKKVAAGIRTAPDVQPIYALEQCTPDLSATDCTECLTRAIDDIPTCCSGIIGAGVLRPSCTLRFENYRFYSASMVEVPQEPFTGTNETNTSPGKNDDDDNTKVIIIIVVISGVTLLFVACIVFFVRKRMKQRTEYIPQATEEISTVDSLQYDFGKIRDATNDFADPNKLGEGGFGAVYHGSLPTGEEIAVKRLSKDSGQGIAEFKNEVLLMAKLQHRNLVRLLGFSTEGTERLLIYELVQNASLDKFIFDPIKRSQLDWDKRYKIIGGVAKGLLYLHEDSRLKIIHRDLKASNILLDGEMNPKIADFGMARLFGQDETQRNTSKIVGTYGYMSPEYAMYGQFSIKSDVFSFGVLVMEIITGRRNIYIQSEENVQDLLTIAWKNWEEGTPEKVIDPIILLKNGMSEIVRCFHMGLLCVQENAANRPTMASIVLMLSSSTITLPRPSEPAFYMASRFGPVVPEFNSKDYAAASQDSSRNHMSVTDFYPR